MNDILKVIIISIEFWCDSDLESVLIKFERDREGEGGGGEWVSEEWSGINLT